MNYLPELCASAPSKQERSIFSDTSKYSTVPRKITSHLYITSHLRHNDTFGVVQFLLKVSFPLWFILNFKG